MAILGHTAYTNTTRLYHDRIGGLKVTATENGVIDDFRFRAKPQYQNLENDVKAVLCASDGTVLSVHGPIGIKGAVPGYGSSWWTITATGSPELVSGVTYWLGVIARNEWSGNDYIDLSIDIADTPTGYYVMDPTNSYSSPQTFGPTNNQHWHTIYVNYTPTGPSLEVEGVTPGQIELVDWTDVSDVY